MYDAQFGTFYFYIHCAGYFVCFALSALLVAELSYRIKFKYIVFVGLVLFVVSSVLGAIGLTVQLMPIFSVSRFLNGMALATIVPIAPCIFFDSIEKSHQFVSGIKVSLTISCCMVFIWRDK